MAIVKEVGLGHVMPILPSTSIALSISVASLQKDNTFLGLFKEQELCRSR